MHRRHGIGDIAHVVQHARLLCRRFAPLGPGIVLVQSGRKILRHRGVEITIGAGDLLLIPDGVDFDLINEPAPDAPYHAFALNFDSDLIARTGIAEGQAIREIRSIENIPPGIEEACRRAMAAIAAGNDLPDAIAAARVSEVLLWLASYGHRFVPAARSERDDRVVRLRKAIAADPACAWRAADAASLLCTSEPSLRRHLAAAGTSFNTLLVDVRMSIALALLQSTDKPVTAIALDVGYDSPSRFSARFRARFDFPPSAIRGHRQDFDRNGTKSDRPGAAAMAAE